MKHLIKFAPVAHVAMSVQHEGNDQQYCEAGKTVRLNWQPSSGWGLLVAGFRDLNDDGAVVTVIDLSTREFTMPDYDIVIMGEARRYNVEQFRSEGEEGQVLGVGPLGLVVPTNVEMPTYEGNEGDLLYSDGNGGIKAADTARINEEGDLEVDYLTVLVFMITTLYFRLCDLDSSSLSSSFLALQITKLQWLPPKA